MTVAPRVWRPTPSGEDLTGTHTKNRRVVVDLTRRPPRSGYRWNAEEWLHDVCGPGTRIGTARTPGGVHVLTVARPHFRRVVEAVALRWNLTEVWSDITDTRACGRLCREATGDECACSCFGANHGGLEWTRGWTRVSEHWVVAHQTKRTKYLVSRANVEAERAQRAAATASVRPAREAGRGLGYAVERELERRQGEDRTQ